MFTYQLIRNECGFFVLFFLALVMTSAQPKGYLYDEQKVRSYTLTQSTGLYRRFSGERHESLEPKKET